MQHRFVLLGLLVAVCLSPDSTAMAQTTKDTPKAKFPLDVTSGEKREGSTTVNGSAKISNQGDKGLIEASLFVRKSGIAGVGYGKCQFIFLDKDGNTIYKSEEVSEQVGAVVLKGTAEKVKKQDLIVPIDKINATQSVIVVAAIKDTGAFDNTEFKDTLDEIIGSGRDELKKGGMTIFKKLIKLG